MRYLLMISLTALFLLACGDADNPVVPTAPAGKATVDLSAEECAAAESLPDGFLEQAHAVDPDLDAELLLTTWKAHGCADWALWGLIWLASLDVGPTFEVEVYETPEFKFDFQHDGTPRIDEVRIPGLVIGEAARKAWDSGSPTLRKAIQDQWREQHLAEAGALSTVSVSGGLPTDGYAVFTFTRSGGHTDESLAVEFGFVREYYLTNEIVSSGSIISGFSPGSETFTHKVPISWRQQVIVSLKAGWESDVSGSYLVGTSSASVLW